MPNIDINIIKKIEKLQEFSNFIAKEFPLGQDGKRYFANGTKASEQEIVNNIAQKFPFKEGTVPAKRAQRFFEKYQTDLRKFAGKDPTTENELDFQKELNYRVKFLNTTPAASTTNVPVGAATTASIRKIQELGIWGEINSWKDFAIAAAKTAARVAPALVFDSVAATVPAHITRGNSTQNKGKAVATKQQNSETLKSNPQNVPASKKTNNQAANNDNIEQGLQQYYRPNSGSPTIEGLKQLMVRNATIMLKNPQKFNLNQADTEQLEEVCRGVNFTNFNNALSEELPFDKLVRENNQKFLTEHGINIISSGANKTAVKSEINEAVMSQEAHEVAITCSNNDYNEDCYLYASLWYSNKDVITINSYKNNTITYTALFFDQPENVKVYYTYRNSSLDMNYDVAGINTLTTREGILEFTNSYKKLFDAAQADPIQKICLFSAVSTKYAQNFERLARKKGIDTDFLKSQELINYEYKGKRYIITAFDLAIPFYDQLERVNLNSDTLPDFFNKNSHNETVGSTTYLQVNTGININFFTIKNGTEVTFEDGTKITIGKREIDKSIPSANFANATYDTLPEEVGRFFDVSLTKEPTPTAEITRSRSSTPTTTETTTSTDSTTLSASQTDQVTKSLTELEKIIGDKNNSKTLTGTLTATQTALLTNSVNITKKIINSNLNKTNSSTPTSTLTLTPTEIETLTKNLEEIHQISEILQSKKDNVNAMAIGIGIGGAVLLLAAAAGIAFLVKSKSRNAGSGLIAPKQDEEMAVRRSSSEVLDANQATSSGVMVDEQDEKTPLPKSDVATASLQDPIVKPEEVTIEQKDKNQEAERPRTPSPTTTSASAKKGLVPEIDLEAGQVY